MGALLGTWTRLRTARRCGCCDDLVAGGEPIYLTGAKALRCPGCAAKNWNIAPPADLPALPPVDTPVLNNQPSLEFARLDRPFADRVRKYFGVRAAEAGGDR